MANAEKLVVMLVGGAPWGFRLSGGGGMPLTIDKIRKKSAAHRRGLKEGDAVLTINGAHVHDKTQDEALELVEGAGDRLTLEILRGGVDELSRVKKKKKPFVVPQGVTSTTTTTSSEVTTESTSFETTPSSGGFTLTASVDEVTSDAFHTPPDTLVEEGGFKLTAVVGDVSGSTFTVDEDVSGGGGFTLTSSVDEVTSSASQMLESSPVLLVADGDMSTSIHSAEVEAISASAGSPVLMAQPYVDSNVIVENTTRLSPNPPRSRSRSAKNSASPHAKQALSPTSPIQNGGHRIPSVQSNGPKSPQHLSPQPQVLSPPPKVNSPQAQVQSPQPQAYSPVPQVYSPKPQAPSPQPQGYSPQPQAYSPKSQVYSPKPQVYSPQPQVFGPKPQVFSPPPKVNSPQAPVHSPKPQAYSPKPQVFSPPPQQPKVARIPLQVQSPNAQVATASPKPQAPPPSPKPVVFVPTPVTSRNDGGITTSVSSSTFDDGTTRREVTHQVQRSDDGRASMTVHRQTTTTTHKTAVPFSASYGPNNASTINSQSSAFNVVQPVANGYKSNFTSNIKTTSSTVKTATPQVLQQPQPQQYSNIGLSRSTGDLSYTNAPIFRPSKFVPGGGKKDVPGLFAPGSPMVDSEGNVVFGKENMAPQPRFEVKNIVSDTARTRGRDVWRPNMWMPGHEEDLEPTPKRVVPETPTPMDDFSPYNTFPLPKMKPGYSLVKETKKKLESRSDYDFDYYNDDNRDDHHRQRRSGKLHVFAPPVEIHADGVYDSPTSPYITFSADGEPVYMYDYEDGPLSPDSTRRRNLYSDSAFYDTPGKSYPTIREQMQLCKKIAQSLTSAANRRARGAKMFMRRKRKSGKWVHEGHSEWSSSAGDVANIRDLDSELSPDEGGNKPLLYFKIPNLKNRVGGKAKQTKMALTQDQFERLRLEAKKCDHNAIPPDTCFGIVADLKAHKGKGGRMFERRRQRTDCYVIDESNSRAAHPLRRMENMSQPMKQDKTPWEAALEHGGNVDAAFSNLTEWERNQRMNALLESRGRPAQRKAPVVPLVPSVQAAPLPTIYSSLKDDGSHHVLRGKDFNRVARGWRGGGEYPVAERLHHVSPTRQTGPSSPNTNYNNKIKAWQTPGQSPYAPDTAHTLPEPPRSDQWPSRRQDDWQPSRVEFRPSSAPQQPAPVRPVSWQSESYHSGMYGDDDYTYAPVDYRYAPDSYPTVAYMQPIIPGTDC